MTNREEALGYALPELARLPRIRSAESVATRPQLGWTKRCLPTAGIQRTRTDEAGNGRSFIGSDSSTRYGWTVGGGIEYALSENWFLRGEYLYVDLGKTDYQSLSNTPGSSAWQTEVDTKAHIARAALTYRITTASSWFEWARAASSTDADSERRRTVAAPRG